MRTITLTDELKQMNGYWRLLAGLVNEGLAVVNDERRSPEARLEQLREKLEFAQRYTQVLPSSIRAELDADPRVQAALEHVARRYEDPQAADAAATWVLGEDGDFHEAAPTSEPGERLQLDDQVQLERPEDCTE
jgi:hypothetical protein